MASSTISLFFTIGLLLPLIVIMAPIVPPDMDLDFEYDPIGEVESTTNIDGITWPYKFDHSLILPDFHPVLAPTNKVKPLKTQVRPLLVSGITKAPKPIQSIPEPSNIFDDYGGHGDIVFAEDHFTLPTILKAYVIMLVSVVICSFTIFASIFSIRHILTWLHRRKIRKQVERRLKTLCTYEEMEMRNWPRSRL